MNRKKRIFALVLSVVMLISSCLSLTGAGAPTLGQQKDQLSSQLAAQKKEQERLSALLAEAKKDVNNQLGVIQLLYDEMNSYQNQLKKDNCCRGTNK